MFFDISLTIPNIAFIIILRSIYEPERKLIMEHKGTQTLETGRLILRRFEPGDGKAMYSNWASDPRVTKFLMWPTHRSIEESESICSDWVGHYDEPDYYLWAIVPKELGEPVGSIAAVDVNDRAQSVHIGYCMGYDWWGRGLMAEALRAVIKFFFEEVGVDSVTSRHDPRNPNSGRVMLKAGMTREGTMRCGDSNNQGICAKAWYSLTREEYERAKRFPYDIRRVEDADQKRAISREILEALPDWFAVPESREQYIRESADQLFFAAFDGEKPVGFICMKETGADTVELAVMGVLKEYHRHGIGRMLFAAIKRAASRDYSFIQVKTVKMGMYDDYDDTNRFYKSLGFKELEVFPLYWDEANPCQIYVMSLGR